MTAPENDCPPKAVGLKAPGPVRIGILILAALAIPVAAFMEWGLAYPLPGWFYAVSGLLLAVALVRPLPLRSQWIPLVILGIALSILAAFYAVPWTSRKPFLRDLARVRVGMTESEVRAVMSAYIEGTGWPASPFSGAGELKVQNSIVFRHSNQGRFNSDWGIVTLSNGRVVGVEFHAD